MPMAVTSMPPPKHTSFCPMPGAIMPDKNTPAPAVITISPAPTSAMNNISKVINKTKTKHSKNLEEQDIKDEIKAQQIELEKKIEQDFKGKYVITPF